MEPFEVPGRHLLEGELDDVGTVGVGAAGSGRRAPGAQRLGAALLCVEPRGIDIIGGRWLWPGPQQGDRVHHSSVPAGRSGDHALGPETALRCA
jgi:hypothetical protein